LGELLGVVLIAEARRYFEVMKTTELKWRGLGIGALALLAILLVAKRAAQPDTSKPGWEKDFIGQVLPTVRNQAGDKLVSVSPYAGNVKLRLVSMGDTWDLNFHSAHLDITNTTLVAFEFTSECNVFITWISCDVEFLDSWGKVIASCGIDPHDIKPFGRQVIHDRVNNLPRERLHTWRVREHSGENPKMIFRPEALIQRVEGSNTEMDPIIRTSG
jgi:hypothetical protein